MATMGEANMMALAEDDDDMANLTIFNVTHGHTIDFYEIFIPKAVNFHRYVTPFVWAVGFPGNILSLLVWIQRRMRHSSGCYLAALAMDDLVFLAMHIVYELHTAWKVQTLNAPVICQVFPMMYLASQYLSPLLVLGFTVERYISICHPFKREKYCTTKRAKIVIACLVILALCMSVIQGYFYVLYDIDGCSSRHEISGTTTSLFNMWNLVVEMFVFLLVPTGVLLLNILVIRELRRLSRVERTELRGRSQRTSATTVMLLAVSFYQIFTTLPVTIVYTLYFEFPTGGVDVLVKKAWQDPVWNRYLTYTSVQFFIQEFGITHYAFNIFIYVLTGKVFRKELKKLMCSALCEKIAQRIPEYTSLRSTARTSLRIPSLWVSVNGHTEKEREETTV